jgi:hypothetical protein
MIDKEEGVRSAISSFEPCSGVVSCKNSTLAGEVGISEVSTYVMIGTSSDNSGAFSYKSSSGVMERIFFSIDFPSSTSHCTTTPSDAISRYSADSMLKLCRKCSMNIAPRIINSRPDVATCLYRGQVAPIVSPSF